MKIKIQLYILTLFFCFNSIGQTNDSLKLGAKITDLNIKYDSAQLFYMVISHGQIAKAYICYYNYVEYFIGLNENRQIVFIGTSDKEYFVDSIQYLKIRFKDLPDSLKGYIYYEAPFAYSIKINEEWRLAFNYEDRKKKKGVMSLRNNALPMFIFKRNTSLITRAGGADFVD